MEPIYIKRALEKVLLNAISQFPAVVLTGPRQSGKTTLLRRLCRDTATYVSLETPDVRAAAVEDPRGFLQLYPPPVIFDEVQYAADLLPYIKERIDEDRHRAGQYFLTGSQNLLLLEKVTESLAGRAAILKLLPISRREEEGLLERPFPWALKTPLSKLSSESERADTGNFWDRALRGQYPELVANTGRDIQLWHGSYIQTYLERDVRSLRQIGDLTIFQSFLRMLAARSGQLLNLAGMGRDLGVALNTVKKWVSVLEATHQICVLRPYFVNVNKTLVKTPKIYFTDTGTLSYLCGLRDPQHAATGPMGGAIFETSILSEIRKTFLNSGEEPRIYFWRTTSGWEVDFVVEWEGKLIPIEAKTSATPNTGMAKGIRIFQDEYGDRAAPGWVIHSGDITLPLGSGSIALPFRHL